MFNGIRQYGIFVLLPGIVLINSIVLKVAIGPYWLATNFDPSYLELANGLRILKGVPVNDATHPGTPLQILIGGLCWLCNMGHSAEDIVTRVLTAPEHYLNIIFFTLTLFSFIASITLAVYVFNKKGDRLAACLTQLPALSFLLLKSRDSFDPVLPIATNVSPEAFQLSILNLFNICILMCFFSKPSKNDPFLTLFWGFVSGLGTAIKFTFAPILIVPLIILSWKNKVLFIAVFLLSFFVWTLPAISKYPIVWGWVSGFLTHKGVYSTGGQAGIIEIHSFLSNWEHIITGHWVYASFLMASLLLSIWKLAQKQDEKASIFLLVTAIGTLLQFSFVAKNPGEHYLVPGLGLFGSSLALFYLSGVNRNVLGRRIVFVLILVCTLVVSWRAMEYRSKMASFSNGILTFYNYVNDKYKGFIFLKFYRASGPDAALQFGDGWNGQPQLRDELFQAYPNSFFFNVGSNRIVSFKDRVLSNDLVSRSSGILFQGDDTFNLEKEIVGSPFSVVLLEKGSFESIYLLTNTTEKQSVMYYFAAVHFLQAEDYSKSLACALQAKAYNYQPPGEIDKFIQVITPYAQQ